LENPVGISEHIVVPETQDSEAGALQSLRALTIDFVGVLSAVDFDDEGTLQTGEIENEIIERMLATEFAAFDLTASQSLPKMMLCRCRRVSQAPLQFGFENASVRLFTATSLRTPSPPNPPLKGRAKAFRAPRP
jgi:hypothetical protein